MRAELTSAEIAMSGSHFDDVLRDPRRYGIENATDKVRRPGAVRRRRDAVCTERIVATRKEVVGRPAIATARDSTMVAPAATLPASRQASMSGEHGGTIALSAGEGCGGRCACESRAHAAAPNAHGAFAGGEFPQLENWNRSAGQFPESPFSCRYRKAARLRMAGDAEFAAKPHARRAPMRHRMAKPYWKFPFSSIRGNGLCLRQVNSRIAKPKLWRQCRDQLWDRVSGLCSP